MQIPKYVISSHESAVAYYPTVWNALTFSVIANAALYFPNQSSQCSLCSFLYPDPTLSYAKKDPFPKPFPWP